MATHFYSKVRSTLLRKLSSQESFINKFYLAKRSAVFLILIAVLSFFPLKTLAQNETPYDLANAVNNLRASYGLEPYQIDPWLMAYAQDHAEYQASIQSGTHIHRDGTLSLDIGLQENVAGGDAGVVTVAIVVYEIWSDWGHRQTMIGYETGDIGAGMALSENGQVYYTINIRPGNKIVSATTQPGTSLPQVPLTISTPNEDGSIIHIVSYGETLWSIALAYGVSVDDIRRLNGMASDSTLISIGQKLWIRLAFTATLAPSGEASSMLNPLPSPTPVPAIKTLSPTQTTKSSLPKNEIQATAHSDESMEGRRIDSVVLVTIGIIALLIAALSIFWKAPIDKAKDPQ